MIKKADINDLNAVTELMLCLWKGHDRKELEKENERLLSSENDAVFLYFDKENAAGFAQCSLRHDYVEGTKSSPVGYLEGIFVAEQYRGRGAASLLLSACENWAENMGCREFASDCEISNSASLKFHLKLGFEEANRIICFKKYI